MHRNLYYIEAVSGGGAAPRENGTKAVMGTGVDVLGGRGGGGEGDGGGRGGGRTL